MIDKDQVSNISPSSFRGQLIRFRQAEAKRYRSLLLRFKSAVPLTPWSPPPPPPPLELEHAKKLLNKFPAKQKVGQERVARDPLGVNPWRAAGLRRDEVRNCGVLSWFMDPVGDHGQGFRFLRCFTDICELATDLPESWDSDQVVVRNERWLDSKSRADIQIVGRRFVIQIEAKIGAPIDPDQLARYHALMLLLYPDPCKRVELLLSLHRVPRIATPPEGMNFITWGDMARALRLFGGEGTDVQRALSPVIQDLGHQYADYIEDVILI